MERPAPALARRRSWQRRSGARAPGALLLGRSHTGECPRIRRGSGEHLPLRRREGLQNLATARSRRLMLVIAHAYQEAMECLWTAAGPPPVRASCG